MERSSDVSRGLQELDAELASASKRARKSLVWTAADREILELIAATIDRKVELTVDYDAEVDISPRVKLSADCGCWKARWPAY